MKTKLLTLAFLLIAAGCDANLTEPIDTTSFDQIASTTPPDPSDDETIDCDNYTSSNPFQIFETDGSWLAQNWMHPDSVWDPTLQHGSIFDQDVYYRGECQISHGCEYTTPNNFFKPGKYFKADSTVVPANDPANGLHEFDYCVDGTRLVQYEVNMHTHINAGTIADPGRPYCSAQGYDCPYGCSIGNGVCNQPVDIKLTMTGTSVSNGEMTAECGSVDGTSDTLPGAHVTLQCDADDQLTLTCDVSSSSSYIEQFERKLGSQWLGVSPDCGNNQNTCSYTVPSVIAAPGADLEYRCVID